MVVGTVFTIFCSTSTEVGGDVAGSGSGQDITISAGGDAVEAEDEDA